MQEIKGQNWLTQQFSFDGSRSLLEKKTKTKRLNYSKIFFFLHNLYELLHNWSQKYTIFTHGWLVLCLLTHLLENNLQWILQTATQVLQPL